MTLFAGFPARIASVAPLILGRERRKLSRMSTSDRQLILLSQALVERRRGDETAQ